MTTSVPARSAPGCEEGEVVVFDKAYVDFEHLHDLAARGVQWVTRAKDNFRYRAKLNVPVKKGGKMVKDQIVKLTGPNGRSSQAGLCAEWKRGWKSMAKIA